MKRHHQRLRDNLAIFTSNGPKQSIPLITKGALPNLGRSGDNRSDTIGAQIFGTLLFYKVQISVDFYTPIHPKDKEPTTTVAQF